MDNINFNVYANIKKNIADLEAKAKELQPTILSELKERTKDLKEKNLRFEFGTFSVTERKNWEYSPAIQQTEELLKSEKKKEEESGVAVATITESLRFQ